MGPKWLSHLTYAKQMVRALWEGSSQVPAYRGKDRGLHQETRILSHPPDMLSWQGFLGHSMDLCSKATEPSYR